MGCESSLRTSKSVDLVETFEKGGCDDACDEEEWMEIHYRYQWMIEGMEGGKRAVQSTKQLNPF